MSRSTIAITIGLSLATGSFAGCTTSARKWSPSALYGRYFKNKSRDSLVDFKADDGNYFPTFIKRFFPGSGYFEKHFPDLVKARQGVQMVEVRKLTSSDDAMNEANLSWSADGVYLGFEIIGSESRRILLKDLMGDFARELMVLPGSGSGNFLEGLSGGGSSMMSYNAGLRWSRDSNRFAAYP